ncbi:TIGR00730 family Rossman fold protein [Olivibacter ginsenosidimutans]|uniref:Cytokinin riboside 5'-monophosphate phosphoribohydrolase n=1 Tax=Olivibacter ginsenosidimutans TaxID=1176537 RepID=A0ABP9BLM5_9SPHI
MKHITVFCGSNMGTQPIYEAEATRLGESLAQQHIQLIYGGTKVGLMGAVANGALQQGGEVIGVLPDFLMKKEIAHEGITKLHIVETMHQRKTMMHDLSDGFIALPGGFGTMEELFEIITWAQLGLHQKPIGVLNTYGFYNNLELLLRHMVFCGFLKEVNFDMLLVDESITGLLDKMRTYQAPSVGKWLAKEEV